MSLKHFMNRKLFAGRLRRPDSMNRKLHVLTVIKWLSNFYVFTVWIVFVHQIYILTCFYCKPIFCKGQVALNRLICQLCAFDQDNRLQSPITLIFMIRFILWCYCILVHVICSGAHMGLIVWLWCTLLNPSQKMIYYYTLYFKKFSVRPPNFLR